MQDFEKVLEAAAAQLSYRALTAKKLREKLSKYFSEEEVAYAIAWLTERNLLDDQEYADATVRSYKRRGYGPLRIRQELRHRGVEQQTAKEALDGFAANREAMRAILDKRLHGDLSDRKEVQKAIAALQRRGFLWDDIRSVLNEYSAEIAAEFE